ncbi:PDZ domain-containing protein, partial [Candidatus Pelagibacter sp.]|nr:PDZ domain-containing protein [Candidatus Pelagibacter sp.]
MKKFLNFIFLIALLNFNTLHAETKQRPWIGIEFTDVTEEFIKLNNLDIKTPKNIIVTGVVETSAADEANIVPGDVIISINNKITKVKQDLIEILKTKYAGDIVNLKIYRQGNTLTKNVILKKFPDPGFKPSWIKGSKLLKNPKKKNYGFENIVLTSKDTILYPKYFSKEVVSKYNNENLTVVCVQKGLKNNLQLYDQIISIDERDPRNEYYNLTNKSVKVKFKRSNKTFTKLITPTLNNRSLSIRHDCTPEFAMYDCLIDYDTPWKLDKNNKKEIGDAWRKALKCMKKISPVPFSNAFFNKKQPDQSVKLDTITWMLGYLHYDAQDLKSKKNLEEINAILVLAKNQLKEFEKFQKIYPNHLMEQSYNDLLNAITRATSWAAGSYSDNLKSTKNTTIKTDKNTTKAIKAAYEKIIKENKINSQKAVKFLTSKSKYLERDNELNYLIKNYQTTKININWKQDNLDKYFDNIYENLSRYYLFKKNYEESLSILDEGLDIAKDNYENLYFKNAFTNLIMGKMFIYLVNKTEYFVKYGDELKVSAEFHLNGIEKLSTSNKDRMLEIGDDYYTDLNYVLYILDLIKGGSREKELTYYPLKSIEFIEKNKKRNFDNELVGALSLLLQGAALEDDIKNFNYANNELAIYMSESANNPARMDALLTSSTMLLNVYETKGYYKKSDKFIKFIEDISTIDEMMKNNSIMYDAYILYDYYRGQSALRNNNIKKARVIFEKRLQKARINLKNIDLNMTVADTVITTKFVPELYEIYYNEKSFEKLERINRNLLGGTDISSISKK